MCDWFFESNLNELLIVTHTHNLLLLPVVLLYLGNNDFVGPIPSTIGQLSTIERLAFNDNRLNGTFPQHQFFNLTDLALQRNNLTGTIPELGNMTNLGKKEL